MAARPDEWDEAWVEAAIARHRWNQRRQAEFEARVGVTEVSVHSPDALVEVRVRADGSIRKVDVVGPLHGRTGVEVSRAIGAALGAAAGAADWARRTLYAEMFGRYPAAGLPGVPAGGPPGVAGGGGPAAQPAWSIGTGSSASRARSVPDWAGTSQDASGRGASGSGCQCRQTRSTPTG